MIEQHATHILAAESNMVEQFPYMRCPPKLNHLWSCQILSLWLERRVHVSLCMTGFAGY